MKNALLFAPVIFLFFLFLHAFPGIALAADSGSDHPDAELQRYVAVGKGAIFALHEPSGWKMDTGGSKEDGVPVVFYPLGQTWKTAPVVMYVNTALNDCHTSFESFIADDEAGYRKGGGKVTAAKIGEMRADNMRVTIKSFSGDKYGNTEAVAYIDNAGGSFISIVLSAKTAKLFDETYPVFKDLVSSFQLVGNSTCVQLKMPSLWKRQGSQNATKSGTERDSVLL